MEITVKTKDLLQELTLATLVADKRSTLPILSCVLMEAHKPTLPGEEGRLSLVASDLDQFVSLSLPAEVKKPGKVAISLKKLADYVRLVEADEIKLKATDSWGTIQAGQSKTRMALLGADQFPENPSEPGETPWKIPARPLAAAIERTIFAVETSNSKFTLNGCLLDFSKDGLRVVSTDGHRMCLAEVACKHSTDKRILFSRNAMATVAKLAEFAQLGEEFCFSLDAKHQTTLVFQLGQRTLFSRALTGNFPDYMRVMPSGYKNSAVVSRQAFARGLGRARLFTDVRSSGVKLEIGGEKLELSAATADLGESAEQIDLKLVTGTLPGTGFNAQYLLDFLSAAGTDLVQMAFKDVNSPLVLQPWVEGEEAAHTQRYDCIVMPMRI